jgi:hypothetical protein
MGAAPVKSRLTEEDLFTEIVHLQPVAVDRLTRRLLSLQAHRKAPHIAEREAELLRIVYRDKRPGFRERYDELMAKRRAESLSTEEHEELLRLTDESEAFDAERLFALGELSQLRETTLPALMKDLGLKAPRVV